MNSRKDFYARWFPHHLLIPACILMLVLLSTAHGTAQTWTHDSYADFIAGEPGDAGRNLYVTADGQVKAIQRFDLNADGIMDLVFNSSHDFVTTPPLSLLHLSQGREAQHLQQIAARGTRQAAVADLNQDGHQDLVVIPNHDWQSSRRYLQIFWGSETGWSLQYTTRLISIQPHAFVLADVNNDGWKDIVVLNGTQWAPEDGPGQVIRTYWGGPESFNQGNYKDLHVDGVRHLIADDFDSDGWCDLALLKRSPGQLHVYWGREKDDTQSTEPTIANLDCEDVSSFVLADMDGDGRRKFVVTGSAGDATTRDPTTGAVTYRYGQLIVIEVNEQRAWSPPRIMNLPPFSAMALGDFDGDNRLDIAIAQSDSAENSVQILWARDSYTANENTTVLPAGHASALAVADLDSDGNNDLVVGVHRTEETYDASSHVFWGDGKGAFDRAAITIPTYDVAHALAVPNDNGSGHTVIFCNNIAGRIQEDIPVRVFWGGKNGFDPDQFAELSIVSGLVSHAADLNDDGFVDLVLSSIVHNVGESDPRRGFNILWGGPDGLRDDHRTILHEHGLNTLHVADMNRDGYLDLVGACNHASLDDEPPRIVIWHGSNSGFDRERRTVLSCPGIGGPSVVADFNNDGYLDIAVSQLSENRITIFWGDVDGFSLENRHSWPSTSVDDIETADLNGDGWLDIVASSYEVPGTIFTDYGTSIYWGGLEGFSSTRAQRLPGHSSVGITIADFDGDGWLDLFAANYRMTVTREGIPSYLFWGGEDGFMDDRRTALPVDSGHDALAGDFNGDGLLDLAIAAHSRDGDHFTHSVVYYNDGHRFATPAIERLPTVGPHYMYRVDAGNVRNRNYQEEYRSAILSWDTPCQTLMISYQAIMAHGSSLHIEARTASSAELLERSPWQSVIESSTQKEQDGSIALSDKDRCMQYRVVFHFANGDTYPILDRVQVQVSNVGD